MNEHGDGVVRLSAEDKAFLIDLVRAALAALVPVVAAAADFSEEGNRRCSEEALATFECELFGVEEADEEEEPS